MARQAGMQPGSTSPKAGKFQRRAEPVVEEMPACGWHWDIPKLRRELERPPVPPTSLAVRVIVTDELVFYANENGSLYRDPGLREPTRLQIFERIVHDDSPDDEGDDAHPAAP